MYELNKKFGKVLTSKSVGTGPSSYEEKNLQGRSLTIVEKNWCWPWSYLAKRHYKILKNFDYYD